MLQYLLLIILLCLVCFHVCVRHSKYGRAINKLPGPPPLPILGNVLLFLFKNPEDTWRILNKLTKTYFPITKLWFFTMSMVISSDPDDVKVILSDKVNTTKGSMYKAIGLYSKTGLVTSTGEKWQERRKMITPSFHINILKQYIDIASEQGEHLIKSIKAQDDTSIQNLKQVCSNLCLSIFIEAATGVKLKVMQEKVDEYQEAMVYFFSTVAYRATRPYIQDWMLTFSELGRNILNSLKILHGFSRKMIEIREGYHSQIKQQSYEDFMDNEDDQELDLQKEGEGDNTRISYLDFLLLAKKEGLIDDEGVKEEIDTFIATGADATGITMVYILMLLAEHKEYQELARAEANRILTVSEGKITMKELQQMDYIDRFVKESLRLYPAAPYISRTLITDVQLKNGLVPAGTDVFVPIHAVHGNPKHWLDPMKFNPDRHLPEEVSKRHPYAYIPFSHGPRNCIGQKVGLNVMKLLTACIVNNFYLEPVDYLRDLQFKVHAILLTTKDPHIKFTKIIK